MTPFTFPRPSERTNAAAIPVPPHTLLALVAGALAWEIDTGATYPGVVWPQLRDATLAALALLSDDEAHTAAMVAERLMRERTEAERGT